MSKFRRILSVFLTLCLLCTLFPAQVIAVDETPAVPQAVTDVTETDVVSTGHVSTGVQYNPLYPAPAIGGTSQQYYSGTGTVSVEDADYLTSVEEAAAVLRAGMVQRAADIPVYYRVDAAQCDGSDAAVIAICNEIFDLALAHTGISTEGDALRWVYESFHTDISYSVTNEYYYFGYTFHMTYYTTAEQEAVLTAQVDQILSGFAFDENTDDYTKIKTIYDYICDNVVYDYDNLNDGTYKLKHTAYAALMNGTSVCQGYALLLYRMLLDVGVDCRVITGIGGGDNHAWNIIAVDGAYYNADSTWDAGVAQYGYFLTCDANFPDHTRDDSYTTDTFHAAYPMGTADYDPDAEAGGELDEVASGTCGTNLTWVLTDDGTLTISGQGAMDDFDYPSYTPWYDYVHDIKLAVIENNVTSLGTYAFEDCASLTSVELPDTLTSIGNHAFEDCSALTEIVMPDSVTSIGSSAFYNCSSLTAVGIPEGVTSIGEWAFYGCSSLTSITFSGDAPSIYNDAFYNVTATVYYPYGNDTWNANTMLQYGGALTWKAYCPGHVEVIDPAVAPTCTETGLTEGSHCDVCGEVLVAQEEIPANGHSYSEPKFYWAFMSGRWICEAFRTCDIDGHRDSDLSWATATVKTPATCIEMGWTTYTATFDVDWMTTQTRDEQDIALTDHTYDDGVVTTEPTCADEGVKTFTCSICGSIKTETVEATGEHEYENGFCIVCGEEEIYTGTCGNNLTWVLTQDGTLTVSGTGEMYSYSNGSAPWYSHRVSIQTVVIEEGVTSIGSSAFYYCTRLTSVKIPESVTSIHNYAFYGCPSLTAVELPDALTSIGSYAFHSCSALSEIVIPEGVTFLGSYAFEACVKLTSVEIPEGVTSIGHCTFCSCSALSEIVIPEGITSIGDHAFEACVKLTSVEIPEGVTSIGYRSFYGCSALTELAIPDSVASIGEYAFYRCSSLTAVVIPNGITIINSGAFSGCSALTSVELPDTLMYLSNGAFSDCSALTSVELPDTLISIGHGAFSGCSALTAITIPDSVTTIKSIAFARCSALTEVELPDILISIGERAFEFCTSLTEIVIPEGITAIGYDTFYGCTALRSIVISDSVTSIGYRSFCSCTSLTEIVLPDGLTSIEKVAFYNCSALTEITIPEGVTSIGELAFSDCSSLTEIVLPEGITAIGEYAFSDCSSLTSITFSGNAPTINADAFRYVTATVYYPAGNDTWTDDVMQNYGGTLTWKARCPDHVEVIDPAVAPTCTETGLTEGSHCSVCGEILVAQEVVDALGHTWTSAAAVQPGFEQKVCTGCAGVMQIPLSGWVHLDGTWYHCTQPGVVDTGWHFVDGQLHYFSTNGAAATGWQQIDGARYYFDSLGALVAPDPRYAGVTQFYPDDSGEMVPGWKQLDDTWYYFNESGCMVPGWREIRGTLYYYTDSGAWMPCWKEIGGTWYYYSRSDTAEPYWQMIGGFWDYPLSSGVNS